jgi:mannose-1-phosphate guanylyltransferase
MPSIAGFWAVIPAGGAGTRLWPLSRASSPKFLHDLTGTGRSLLQATMDRLTPLVDDRVLVVTGAAHQAAVAAQLTSLNPANIVAEPQPRDSMPAIALAAALVAHRDPEAFIGSFAADHVVRDAATFTKCVELAVGAARDGWLVTIGIQPTHPATGFGYIQLGDPLPGHDGVRLGKAFVEKPSAELAERYLSTGEFRWNAGMFVVRAATLLELLAQWHPALAAGVRAIAADETRLAEIWPDLERIAIDHAVAEPAAAAGRVAVVPATFGWEDIGDFASLRKILPRAASGPTVLGDANLVYAVDADGLVLPTSGRTVAVVGLSDVVVVDTPDALLVTSVERAQDVKRIVDALKATGRTDLT